MKYKPNQTRTFDADGYRRRAACLCFRSESEQEVLLVSSSRYPDKWIVPGGGMEPEEEAGVAAMREVFEEAGVKGDLGRLLGVFENQERKHRTYVYILIVTEILEDWEDSVNIGKETHAPSAAAAAAATGRKRGWFSVDAAIECLQAHKPVQATYLQKHKQGGPAGVDSATVNNGAAPTPVATATEDKAATNPIASTPDVR